MTIAVDGCPVNLRCELSDGLAHAQGPMIHDGGTYVCMEGPQFSTLAESQLYRSWGMDIIGMTNLQEAKLAREAEMCYATLALVTDYDCWHPDHDSVTVDLIIANLSAKGYEEMDRTHLIDPTNTMAGRKVVWVHPTFAGKCVFVRNDAEVICYSLAK